VARNPAQIQGEVAPGFESVRALYEHNMQTLEEKQTQLCIYVKGEKVVDLWASVVEGDSFSADSLVNVFSSGKSFEALAIAWLFGRGLLRYGAKVIEYWPEFGANGKQGLTIAELMRHEAGLAAFDTSIAPEDLLTGNIKQNRIGHIVEAHAQKFRKDGGSRREYHAVTRGWIVNEVFRRIDPAGRTIGEFLAEEVSGPLGVDANIGVKAQDLARVVDVAPLGVWFRVWQGTKPKFLKRRMEHNLFQTAARLARLLPNIRKGTTAGSPPPFKGMKKITFFNERSIRMGETPSANATCSARALAKIAATIAAGGKFGATEILNDAAWTALHDGPDRKDMGFATTTFTQGGVAKFTAADDSFTASDHRLNAGREGFYGWMGLGGSLFQWHPQHQIGFGYVPTSLNVLDFLNERGKAYQAEVLRCIR
jgi:CubicO group peptidase (beta-lactamase class C family)